MEVLLEPNDGTVCVHQHVEDGMLFRIGASHWNMEFFRGEAPCLYPRLNCMNERAGDALSALFGGGVSFARVFFRGASW